ncbi:VOC family protein [Vulcaniibacterium tengchongense]|uniref:PhnB protein n=1 Tax=Vulcaniibacterium tengchongense TaxID=1273429 RepID=A0A3N4V2L2_9GAMM|nr:VOC family protein [Vulcaniibacterium tengchongense]RPE77212.1 PhnB protein [Vulcaniibacterium tengchongense]
MKLNAYLNFDGRCEEAFAFYQRCLGGRITDMMRFGDTPARDHVPAALHGKIMHACLELDGQLLMGADAAPQCPYEGVKGASMAVHAGSIEEAERLYAQLSEGGSVQMPLEETFWARRFAAVTDRFGVPWLINCA